MMNKEKDLDFTPYDEVADMYLNLEKNLGKRAEIFKDENKDSKLDIKKDKK